MAGNATNERVKVLSRAWVEICAYMTGSHLSDRKIQKGIYNELVIAIAIVSMVVDGRITNTLEIGPGAYRHGIFATPKTDWADSGTHTTIAATARSNKERCKQDKARLKPAGVQTS